LDCSGSCRLWLEEIHPAVQQPEDAILARWLQAENAGPIQLQEQPTQEADGYAMADDDSGAFQLHEAG